MSNGKGLLYPTLPGLLGSLALAAAMFTASAEPAEAARCKDYSRCEQAVANWCAGGHPGADRDRDGIPCENVCSTRAQADQLRQGRPCPPHDPVG